MTAVPAQSLRKRLFRRLLSIVSLIWLVATGAVLLSAWDESREAYEGQALHLAIAMANAFDRGDPAGQDNQPLPENSGRDGANSFFVVVWRDGDEIYRSANAPADVPRVVEPGASMLADETTWFLASFKSKTGGATATVGLDRSEARLFSLESVGWIALPMLIGLILMVKAVGSAIRQGLEPVDQLRRQILG